MSLYKNLPRLSKKKELLGTALPTERLFHYVVKHYREVLAGTAVLIAMVLLGAGLFSYASRWSQDKTASVYKKALSLQNKGIEALSAGDFEGALAYFKKEEALKDNPLHAYAIYYQGVCLEKEGKKEEALQFYARVLQESESLHLQELARQKSVWLKAGL